MASARKQPSREPLSRERIELAAIDLIEAEGLAGFSIRKLANALHCEAMSIYYYFPSKGHLMDGLIDHVVDEIPPAPEPSLPWIERLRIWGRQVRREFTRRPNLFLFVGTHRMNTRKGLAFLDRTVSFMRESGLPEEVAIRMFRAVSYFVMGTALDETAGYARGPTTIAPVPEEEMREKYPAVRTAGRYFGPDQFDATFELGWQIMLDGIEALRRRHGVAVVEAEAATSAAAS